MDKGNSSPTFKGTPITGKSVATAAQMTAYIKKVNPNVPKSVIDMIPLYLSEGEAESIRGDGAFAQSCLETGNFTFGNGTAVTIDQNNFCGMAVVEKGAKGNSYATPQLGIRTQMQHKKAYANTEPLKNALVVPKVGESRFKYVERGIAPYYEWLGAKENPKGKGWATGEGYGAKILTILNSIVNTVVTVAAEPTASSAAIVNGSRVKLRNGAKTFTGGNIASFVYNDTWIVEGNPRDDGRVVVNKNVTGTNAIMTPVNIKDLTKA